VAITCGLIPAPEGTANEVFCAEPLLVGLRPEHRLAGRPAVALSDLAHDVLGTMPEDLFPAWSLSQRQALEAAGIDPPQLVPFTLQLEPRPRSHHGGGPVRPRHADRGTAGRLAYPARPPAPSRGAVAPR
jgi:hypothetical protein